MVSWEVLVLSLAQDQPLAAGAVAIGVGLSDQHGVVSFLW
jgi:hypothetical protein